MVFEGMHERICRFNSKERVICKFEVDFKNSFLLAFNPSNGNIISAYARSEKGCGLKWFWSEIGAGFGEAGGTPLPGILPGACY